MIGRDSNPGFFPRILDHEPHMLFKVRLETAEGFEPSIRNLTSGTIHTVIPLPLKRVQIMPNPLFEVFLFACNWL